MHETDPTHDDAGWSGPGFWSSKARAPKVLLGAAIGVSITPLLLNLVGVDFGSGGGGLEDFEGASVDDAMHYALSGSFTHTILEWSAFCVAIFTVVLALVHFKIKRDVTLPIIGVALFCAGCMDAFHTLAADRLIEAVAPNENLIPFTWAICRMFNVGILLIGVGMFLLRRRPRWRASVSFVVGVSAAFGLIAYLTIHFCATSANLPKTMFPGALITRPYDVVPLVLLIFAASFVYWRFYRLQPSIFSYALLVSLIPDIAIQLHMAFGSNALFDNHFNVAHFLKIVAYVIPLAGLCLQYIQTLKDEQAAREELREHRDHLEELVAERTAALESSHEQLRQSERLASIGTLAAGLGHDMNNILFPVRCRLDTLQAQRLGEHTSEELAAICVSIDYLQHLSNGLHQLALNPDDSHASTVCTHMTIWVKDTWALLRSALPAHATLECEFADDLPPLAVPPHQMTQAIFNLVVNAGEAIGDHGTVRISAETRDSGQTVCISVSDDGHGMSTEVTKRALDPFFTTKTRGLSTGLGLALVQGVAASAGGHVEINSTPGGGATIGLCVPVADEPERSGRALGERSLHATVSVHDRRMATMFSSILENAGFEVSHAGDKAASDSSLWVADASVATPEAAALFLDGSESGRIIVLGPASDAYKHRVTVVDGTAGVEAIRTAISGILSLPAEIGS